jgi:NitT/TauT family transport system substrate-binding protein
MQRKGIVLFLAAGVIILTILGFLLLRRPAGPEKVEKLRLGIFPDPICALIYIAQQQGMFKRHGLDLAITNYQAGAYAVNDLLADKVDVATATGFVLALQGFKRPDLRTIGAISSADTNEVVARTDSGIKKPADLRGRLIGVSKGTANEYFLSTFLALNGVLPAEVRTVDIKPADLVLVLSEGKIDAAVCFPPFSDTMKKNMSNRTVSWPVQGGQDYYFLLIIRDDLIKARPLAVTNLLKGALEAEDFLRKHESEAQAIVERSLGLGHASVASAWSKTRFRVRLDQALLTLMEDEGRWAIRNKLVDAKKVPNYLPFLYLEGLGKLRPDAVGVVH